MTRMFAVAAALMLAGSMGAAQARTKVDAPQVRSDLRVQNVMPRIPAAEFRGMAPFVGDAGLLGRPQFGPAFFEPPHTRDAANPNRATD